jgi:hypothetical protein
MSKVKRQIAIFLFFILSCLSAKNLFLVVTGAEHGNCQEFGHLHFVKLNTIPAKQSSISSFDQEDLNDCHEGKSFLSSTQLPVRVLVLMPVIFQLDFSFVFSLDLHFQSPVLEPHRRPPKLIV